MEVEIREKRQLNEPSYDLEGNFRLKVYHAGMRTDLKEKMDFLVNSSAVVTV